MTYVIALPCVDVLDKACIEECPVDCIYEGDRMLYIHPDECVDCGACEPVCPVEAIYYEDDVPDQWKDFYNANVEFFEDLGSPGGAAKTGKINKDHPLVAALPPQGTSAEATGDRRRRRAARFPLGRARAAPSRRRPAPRWDRRPVDRDAGRPDAGPCVQRGVGRGGGIARLPAAHGTAALRTAAAGWLERRLGVRLADPLGAGPSVIPGGLQGARRVLPTLLGLRGAGTVVIPEVGYPTYEVGAVLAGLAVRRSDIPPPDAAGIALVWLNSPGNPPAGSCPTTSCGRG